MSNPSILYTDLSAYTFSSSAGTNASHPLSDMNNYMINSYWSGSSIVQGQRLIFDVSFSQDVSSCVIDGHNFGIFGSSSSVCLQYASDAAFTSGVTTISTITTATVDEPLLVSFNSINKRYFALQFSSSGEMNAPPRVGNIFIGSPFAFSTPYESAGKFDNVEYVSSTTITLSGQIRTSQIYAGRMVYEVAFNLQNTALKTAFKKFFQSVRGSLIPFYWIDMDDTIRYMNCASDYVPLTSVAYNMYNIESLV
jgi:hypothetical protein